MAYLIILLHFLVCLAVFVAICKGKLLFSKYMVLLAVLLPLWGTILLLCIHLQLTRGKQNAAALNDQKKDLLSERYRSISVDRGKRSPGIIPMEEALLINSSAERRALILDVLNDDPRQYVEFLQKAGDNDDTEVVHYAVTAMVEISKENDDMLHFLERQYAELPDDPAVLQRYTDFLWDCLSRNMMQGQVEAMNRALFSELMEKKTAGGGSVVDFTRLVTNEMKRKNYTAAGAALDRMEQEHPGREDYYLLKLQYNAALGRGADIQALLKKIKQENIYISAKGREVIAFWKSE